MTSTRCTTRALPCTCATLDALSMRRKPPSSRSVDQSKAPPSSRSAHQSTASDLEESHLICVAAAQQSSLRELTLLSPQYSQAPRLAEGKGLRPADLYATSMQMVLQLPNEPLAAVVICWCDDVAPSWWSKGGAGEGGGGAAARSTAPEHSLHTSHARCVVPPAR
uniref:Uncharacterized protein n=1 Tax=Haptolina brevifila TaxID=156173 RepID=A0A7S2GM02_9EUKA|mmetsp:Transcript_40368/g.80903  ORF Transcript_40368/g.80903 Transcript_40368/m.80903 type:complete len:165 (+) Transcript_40368:239-733(+)